MNYFIFGLQRSGTNYLEQLINQNFKGNRCNRANRCWKHSINIPDGYVKNSPTFIIHKNPYTWIESICFRNSVDWLKTQKTYPAEEGPEELRLGSNNINIENLAKTYKHFYNTWIYENKTSELSYVIKYENLLMQSSREKILNDISSRHLPVRKLNGWINPQRGRISQSKDYDEAREKYYLSMEPKRLNEFHISRVNNILDNVIDALGYTKL